MHEQEEEAPLSPKQHFLLSLSLFGLHETEIAHTYGNLWRPTYFPGLCPSSPKIKLGGHFPPPSGQDIIFCSGQSFHGYCGNSHYSQITFFCGNGPECSTFKSTKMLEKAKEKQAWKRPNELGPSAQKGLFFFFLSFFPFCWSPSCLHTSGRCGGSTQPPSDC